MRTNSTNTSTNCYERRKVGKMSRSGNCPPRRLSSCSSLFKMARSQFQFGMIGYSFIYYFPFLYLISCFRSGSPRPSVPVFSRGSAGKFRAISSFRSLRSRTGHWPTIHTSPRPSSRLSRFVWGCDLSFVPPSSFSWMNQTEFDLNASWLVSLVRL